MYNGEGYGRERKSAPRFPAIDEAIKSKGSVKQFILQAGLHEITYYKMQSGDTNPTLSTIYAILQYTGLTFEAAFMS